MNKHLARIAIGATVVAAVAGALVGCSPADSLQQGAPAASSSPGGPAGPSQMTDVTLQIDGAAAPYYAPLYSAVDQGYFKEHNLNVSITYSDGASILQNVAAGNVPFGFPNGDSVVTAEGHGVSVNVVHTTYQQGIGALLFNKDKSGITSPADLKGKTVAVTDLGSPNYIQLQAMLQSVNLTVSDVKVVTIGTGAIVQALQNGQVDAIVFSRLRYFALQSAGFPVGQILSDQYLPSFGNVLVTSPAYRAAHGDVVDGFTAALDEGIQYVIQNPQAAVDAAISKWAPSFVGQNAAITNVIQQVYIAQLWQSDDTKTHGLGYGSQARWQSAIDAQVKFKLIPQGFQASTLVVEPRDAH